MTSAPPFPCLYFVAASGLRWFRTRQRRNNLLSGISDGAFARR